MNEFARKSVQLVVLESYTTVATIIYQSSPFVVQIHDALLYQLNNKPGQVNVTTELIFSKELQKSLECTYIPIVPLLKMEQKVVQIKCSRITTSLLLHIT